jgi:hypothetical protein
MQYIVSTTPIELIMGSKNSQLVDRADSVCQSIGSPLRESGQWDAHRDQAIAEGVTIITSKRRRHIRSDDTTTCHEVSQAAVDSIGLPFFTLMSTIL